jgi:hypothetical protein
MNAILYWLTERLRDLAMWPVNLVRDFPVRSGRLATIVWRGMKGVVFFVPELAAAAQNGTGRNWLVWKSGRLTGWLHQLAAALFDLLGGPEAGEFLMHLVARTSPLTRNEIAMIGAVLGPTAARFGDVRVVEGGLFDLIFRLNGNLAFATWHSINLPRSGRHTRTNPAVVIHELTHVYQYEQAGSRYLGEAIYWLAKTKRKCYAYGGAPGLQAACAAGRRFSDFNREQQAMIVQDYFTLQQRSADLTAYEPLLVQARAGDL